MVRRGRLCLAVFLRADAWKGGGYAGGAYSDW